MRSGRYLFFGFCAFIAAIVLLFWNEGRAIRAENSLTEGERLVVSVPNASIDPANDGKLIHFTGKTTADRDLRDPDLGIETAGLRLTRKVEMLQWRESAKGRSSGSSESDFSYSRDWSEQPIDSTKFRFPQDHRNPPMPSLSSAQFYAEDARVGAFRIGPRLVDMLGSGQPYNPPPATERMYQRLGKSVQLIQGGVFTGDDPAAARVGDVRVTYVLLPHQPVTIAGRQAGDRVAAYVASNGSEILLASAGEQDATEMFKDAEAVSHGVTWMLRFLGAALIYLACWLALRPLQIAGSYIPVADSITAVGAPTVSLLFTACCAPLIIGIAWIFHRPLLGIPILAASALLGGVLLNHLRKTRALRPVP